MNQIIKTSTCYFLFLLTSLHLAAGERYISVVPELENIDATTPVELRIGIIPGAIIGPMSSGYAWTIPQRKSDTGYKYPIYLLEDEFSAKSQTLSEASRIAGVRVEPEDTRFSRVSTFGVRAGDTNWVSAGFRDGKEIYYVLAYFDRACKVSGEIDFDGVPTRHEFEIPGSGFYWLLWDESQSNLVRIQHVETPDDLRFLLFK